MKPSTNTYKNPARLLKYVDNIGIWRIESIV